MSLTIAFALIVIGPWLLGRGTQALRLPSILGMLIFGILYAALSGDVVRLVPPLPSQIEELSGFIKTTALIVILLRAGLGIRKASLRAVGGSAIRMAIIPCLIETVAATFAFVWLFDLPAISALVGGSILAAVSPAVVVPSMLDLKQRGYHEVPTLVLAGASADDAVAITIFTAAVGLAVGGSVSVGVVLVSFPLAIVNGLVLGVVLGFAASWFFAHTFERIRATEKALVLIVVSLLVVELGERVPLAALLAVMTVGFVLLERTEHVAHEMASKLSKVWVPAEILLFVLIGLAVDVSVAIDAGVRGLAVIGIGIAGRSVGVLAALVPDRGLTWSDRLFALVAYVPKATVQAALGTIPMSMGVEGGAVILAVAVLSILVTAPIGLLLIRALGPRLLGVSPGTVDAPPSSPGRSRTRPHARSCPPP
ncbi:MAG: cation:proton antiporter [Spirochaetota bacterium]